MDHKEFMRELNDSIGDEWAKLFPSSPNYLYWTDKKGNQYFYTIERVNCGNGKPKYASGIYRYLKTKKEYRLRKQSFHATRWRATERAYKLMCKADDLTYTPITPAGRRREKKQLETDLGEIYG